MTNRGIIVTLIILIVIAAGAFLLFGSGEEGVGDSDVAAPQTFVATIENLSDTQPLSPGVYVVHTDAFSLDYEGGVSPAALEPLAEYGSHTAYRDFVQDQEGVLSVISIDAPVLPGESARFTFTATAAESPFLSGVQMLVATNDGIAVISRIMLFQSGLALSAAVGAGNYDNGTEENEAPGSGFAGGQPDPSRGEENVENGTPTDPQEVVAPHAQITEAVLRLTIEPQAEAE